MHEVFLGPVPLEPDAIDPRYYAAVEATEELEQLGIVDVLRTAETIPDRMYSFDFTGARLVVRAVFENDGKLTPAHQIEAQDTKNGMWCNFDILPAEAGCLAVTTLLRDTRNNHARLTFDQSQVPTALIDRSMAAGPKPPEELPASFYDRLLEETIPQTA